jgi:DNA-binding Xre family transcriptional regulator
LDNIKSDIIFLNRLRVIADSFKGHRLKKNWSVTDLSADSGIAEKTIYNIEAGKDNITLRTIIKLAVSLEVDLGERIV